MHTRVVLDPTIKFYSSWNKLYTITSPARLSPRAVSTMSAPRIGVCTLDCTGTIMKIKGSIPRLYLGVLEDELGITRGALPGVSDEALLQAFGKSMKKRSRELPCFGAQVMSSEEWWAGVVRTTFKGAGVRESNLDSVFDRVFQRLRGDFAGKTAWELLPEAQEVIDELRQWCQEDHGPQALGVISNFDERLHPILEDLGVRDAFDFVLTSHELNSEKPDPLMFEQALIRAGASQGSIGVHIGDTFDKDVLGATNAGWQSVFISNREPTTEEQAVEHIRVQELGNVPSALRIGKVKT